MDIFASYSDVKAHADALFEKQDYLGAAEEYRKLTSSHPENPQVLKQLGLSLTMGRLVEEGIRHLETAASLQPADPEIRYAHGYALGVAGRFDDAINELDAALNLQPNHIAARQGLIYCLLTSGQAICQVNPMLGEQRLHRAAKLEALNPHVANAYLKALVNSNQKGKAVAYIGELDASVKAMTPLSELLAELEGDPEFALHLKHASMAPKSLDPSPGGHSRSIQQVPCPACKKQVMNYVTVCPHCGLQIRAGAGFSTRRNSPTGEWKDIAFTLATISWLFLAGLEFWIAYPMAQKSKLGNMYSVQVVATIFQAFFGLGLLFRQEWLSFIAKIYSYISIGAGLLFLFLFLSGGKMLPALVYGIHVAVTCFLTYLISEVLGE